MKVRANMDFGGQYAMIKGTVADLPDDQVIRCLIAEGYIAEVEEEKPKAKAPEQVEEEPAKQDLHDLKVADLVEMCKEKGVVVKGKAKKEDLIKALEA